MGGSVGDGSEPVFFVVHGIGRDYPDWVTLLPQLQRAQPAAIFMYRWSAGQDRDSLIHNLASGINRVAACLAGRQRSLLVLAHSAGGVLASLAAGSVVVASAAGQRVTLVTVASPLAGYGAHAGQPDGVPESAFLLDLGRATFPYPNPAPGVQVIHLHTRYPADHEALCQRP